MNFCEEICPKCGCTCLFRRTPKPLEIQFVSREELKKNPMIKVHP